MDGPTINTLEEMIGIFEDDDEFLEACKENADDQTYEKLNFEMAIWHLEQVREYFAMIIDAYNKVDDDVGVDPFEDGTEELVKVKDIPVTFINMDKIKELDALDVINGKVEPLSGFGPTGFTTQKFIPLHSDEGRIRERILEVLKLGPEESSLPGFHGWLAAEVTGVLGGKSDPRVVLKIVREVLKGGEESE